MQEAIRVAYGSQLDVAGVGSKNQTVDENSKCTGTDLPRKRIQEDAVNDETIGVSTETELTVFTLSNTSFGCTYTGMRKQQQCWRFT